MTTIRAATTADAAALVRLFAQLGYPTPQPVIEARLAALGNRAALYVAEHGSSIVGFIAIAARGDVIEERAVVEGLVVDAKARNAGVGAQLLRAAETWAKNAGAAAIVVRSNVVREDAHRFYEREGYRRRKTQHVFEKPCRCDR